MRRRLLAVLCLLLLALPVRGAEAGNTMEVTAVVDGDGSCRMAVKLTLLLLSRLFIFQGADRRELPLHAPASFHNSVSNPQASVFQYRITVLERI